MKTRFLILLAFLFESNVRACIWDADSLWREKFRSHDLAQTIVDQPSNLENTDALQARIKELEGNRKENDADWWNNLAGAYLRLNQPEAAVKLLEPVVKKFPSNYGIHANLGTAYHLLGEYAEAEKEIARDLEINPQAHFGLEKYHLALLQYLVRSSKYQMRHVFVDEFTASFLSSGGGRFYFRALNEQEAKNRARDYKSVGEAEADFADFEGFATNRDDLSRDNHFGMMLASVAALDPLPPYRAKWNLAIDTNFEAGVIYMGQMNPKEPACLTMLGIVAWKNRDYNLAQIAFEKAITLNSPQAEFLRIKVAGLKDYIKHSSGISTQQIGVFVVSGLVVAFAIGYYFYSNSLRRRGV